MVGLITEPQTVRTGGLRLLGGAVAAWSVGFAVFFFTTGIASAGWVFAVGALPGVLIAVMLNGTIRVSDEAIERKELLCAGRIAWADVALVEFDPAARAIRFSGSDRALLILGPRYWRAGDKDALTGIINEQIKRRGIRVEQSVLTPFRLDRGTSQQTGVTNGNQ